MLKRDGNTTLVDTSSLLQEDTHKQHDYNMFKSYMFVFVHTQVVSFFFQHHKQLDVLKKTNTEVFLLPLSTADTTEAVKTENKTSSAAASAVICRCLLVCSTGTIKSVLSMVQFLLKLSNVFCPVVDKHNSNPRGCTQMLQVKESALSVVFNSKKIGQCLHQYKGSVDVIVGSTNITHLPGSGYTMLYVSANNNLIQRDNIHQQDNNGSNNDDDDDDNNNGVYTAPTRVHNMMLLLQTELSRAATAMNEENAVLQVTDASIGLDVNWEFIVDPKLLFALFLQRDIQQPDVTRVNVDFCHGFQIIPCAYDIMAHLYGPQAPSWTKWMTVYFEPIPNMNQQSRVILRFRMRNCYDSGDVTGIQRQTQICQHIVQYYRSKYQLLLMLPTMPVSTTSADCLCYQAAQAQLTGITIAIKTTVCRRLFIHNNCNFLPQFEALCKNNHCFIQLQPLRTTATPGHPANQPLLFHINPMQPKLNGKVVEFCKLSVFASFGITNLAFILEKLYALIKQCSQIHTTAATTITNSLQLDVISNHDDAVDAKTTNAFSPIIAPPSIIQKSGEHSEYKLFSKDNNPIDALRLLVSLSLSSSSSTSSIKPTTSTSTMSKVADKWPRGEIMHPKKPRNNSSVV